MPTTGCGICKGCRGARNFDLVCELRMEHQVEQLRRGAPPDNLIDPTSLTALTRSSLKEAFREVSRIQRVVGQRLELAAW